MNVLWRWLDKHVDAEGNQVVFRGVVEDVKGIDAAPLDVLKVLLPLFDAQFSFGYGFALMLPQRHHIRVPGGVMETGSITAPVLWNRILTELEQCRENRKAPILRDFILTHFALMKESADHSAQDPQGYGLQVYLQATPVSRMEGQKLFNYVRPIYSMGFYGLPKPRCGLGYSDIVYTKALKTSAVIIESYPYVSHLLRLTFDKLMRRFSFLRWDS